MAATADGGAEAATTGAEAATTGAAAAVTWAATADPPAATEGAAHPVDHDPVDPAVSEPATTERTPGRRARIWRGAARLITLLALAITVMMIALGIGMRSNDAAIDDHLGTATATVLSVSPLRTGIEFVDAIGATIRPEGGVLYPGLLAPGQQFVVEYSTQDPQIARVAGRTAAVGTVMIALTLGVTYLIGLPSIWWCVRRSRLPLLAFRRGPGHVATPPSAPMSEASLSAR